MTASPPVAEFEARVRVAVDPIPASPERKRLMREELLAHLLGAYEQEIDAGGSSNSAIEIATERFGDVAWVRRELVNSVPVFERFFYLILERESQMRIWILVGVALIAIGMGVILPALAKIKMGERLGMDHALVMMVGAGAVTLGLWTIVCKIAMVVRGKTATPR